MNPDALPRSEFAGDLAGYVGGSGPDLLLIHGVGLRADAWRAMLPQLETHFTVTALDMPGHGDSPRITHPGLAGFSKRFADFIYSRNDPVFVAGHSMGAMIAIDLATRHPQKVRALAALNAIHQRPAAAAKAVKARAAALSMSGINDPGATLERWFGPNSTGQDSGACRDWLMTCDPQGYAEAYRVFATHPGPVELHTLHCPALFLTAEHDLNSTPAMSRQMADLCPNGQAIVVNDAAHMAPMTHADMIAQHLIRFLSAKGPIT
jgi:(E)-2-((N-methylformamido)methylene)succinate hydrolase